METDKEQEKEVHWVCRFHPTNWFHEIGCPHMKWTKEQLLSALITAKKSHEELVKRFYEKSFNND